MFQVGQKVVCVDAKFHGDMSRVAAGGGVIIVSVPTQGGIYRVRSFSVDEGVRVEEIVNPVCFSFVSGIAEPSFHERRFRPIIEKSTDTGMAILREILDRESINEKKPARVRG